MHWALAEQVLKGLLVGFEGGEQGDEVDTHYLFSCVVAAVLRGPLELERSQELEGVFSKKAVVYPLDLDLFEKEGIAGEALELEHFLGDRVEAILGFPHFLISLSQHLLIATLSDWNF